MRLLSAIRALFVMMLCALAFGCSAAPEDDEETVDETEDALLTASRYKQVVHARAYQQKHWTLPERTPEDVGNVIGDLRPSYVSGLVRLETPSADPNEYAEMAANYDIIRNAVRAKSPGAKFDIVLNIRKKQYQEPAQIDAAMAMLDGLFHPDGWFFDFLDNGEDKVISAAITYAHSRKQFIGGNLNGGGGKVPFAKRMDFVAITNGTDIGKHIANLDFKGPILVHIENNPHHNNGDNAATQFLKGSLGRRKKIIRDVARDTSKAKRATVMLPVFFPLYPLDEKPYVAYDAAKDGLLPTLKNLGGGKN